MGNRLVTGGIGLLLIVLAVAIAIVSDAGWPGHVAALVVGGLGVDALHSAARKRRSLLSRIGPLP
jgi:membrane associated rhomboid family serine protease